LFQFDRVERLFGLNVVDQASFVGNDQNAARQG
jgi:hypothetical protein